MSKSKEHEVKNQPDMELMDDLSDRELHKKLDEAEGKVAEYWDKLLRMQAEMENVSRRSERDVANAHKFALEKFVNELLPVIDNLERAVEAVHNKEENELIEGINLTLKLFYSVLQKFGVEQINPEGQVFNPEFHQAISTQTDASVNVGTVLSVLQKGYLLNNRLIRPALVAVSKKD